MSVFDKIRELEEQKAKLVTDAKTEALATAKKAIADLSKLGFDYQLVESGSRAAQTGSRRTGIRDQVHSVIKNTPSGLKRAEVLEALSAHGKSEKQSVSNALSALKKAGALTLAEGVYIAT